ncbi:MAG: leucyl aminopeptidase, partial [Planctomycetaceae bacterium]
MKTSLSGQLPHLVEADWLVVPGPEGFPLDGALAQLDEALGGGITLHKSLNDFQGKGGETAVLPAPSGLVARR